MHPFPKDAKTTAQIVRSQVGACVATPVRNTSELPVVQKMPEGTGEPTPENDAKKLCEQVATVEVPDSQSMDETQTQKVESPQHVEPSTDGKGDMETTEPNEPPMTTAQSLKIEATRKACSHVFAVSNHEFIVLLRWKHGWLVWIYVDPSAYQLQSPISIPMQAKLRNAAKSQLNRWVRVHKRHPQKTAPEWLQKEWAQGCKNSMADRLSHCNFNKDRFTGILLESLGICSTCA